MHSRAPFADTNGQSRANSPYSPDLYGGTEPGLPPNSTQSWGNVDYIAACPEPGSAGADKMPCHDQTANRSAAAARSQHNGGVNASQVDGSVIWITDDIDMHLMARKVSINDGEGDREGRAP
jgi:prepilin-type processing-associated H-X9-DG protein